MAANCLARYSFRSMADPEPTLRDVLTELRELRADHGERLEALSGKVSKQGADLAAVRAEMATRDDLAAVRAEMATRDDLADLRADVRAQLEALRADHGAQLEAPPGRSRRPTGGPERQSGGAAGRPGEAGP